MTPDELDELLGAYALDAVDEDERREIEQYLTTNPRARSEVDQYQEVAALLAFSGSSAPDGVWDRIASAIGGDGGGMDGSSPPALHLVSRAPDAAAIRRPRAPWYALGGLAAAAAVVVAILVGMVSHRNDQLSTARAPDVKAAAQAALANPDARKVDLVSTDGRQRVEVAVAPSGVGFGIVEGLPALAGGRTYQLWGQYDGKIVSLGLLGPSPTAIAFPAADGLKALMITEEVAGGVVATANTPIVQGTLT